MDISLIVGWIMGTFLIIYGIGFHNIGDFVNVPGFVMVFGGTAAVLIASYPLKMLMEIPRHIKIMFTARSYDAERVIHDLIDIAIVARKKGLLVLEEQTVSLKDSFLKQSIMLIVDARDAEKIREMLEGEVTAMAERHDYGAGFYEKGKAVAPAIGMIGTLVGLINMLKNINLEGGSPGNLIGNMSYALIAAFYGCVLAQLFFAPMAKKLRIRNDEEVLYKQIIIEGILSIQAGDNPQYSEEMLLSYLSESQRNKIVKKGSRNEGGGGTLAS